MTRPIRVLVVCENREEAQSMTPIAEALSGAQCERGPIDCHFASLDAMFLQGVDPLLRSHPGAVIADLGLWPMNVAYPFAPRTQRLNSLAQAERLLPTVMRHFDCLLSGVDAAPVRVLRSTCSRLGRPSFQIVNALYWGAPCSASRRQQLMNAVRHGGRLALAHGLGFTALQRPPGASHSVADCFFVMGARAGRALQREGVSAERIAVTGVPRHIPLFMRREDGSQLSQEPRSALYLTGAYEWHGLHAGHDWQQAQLRSLASEFLDQKSSSPWLLNVRRHPREQPERYAWIEALGSDLVRLSDPQDAELHLALESAHVALTSCSTAAYEAAVLRRPVVVCDFPSPVPVQVLTDFLRLREVNRVLRVLNHLATPKGLHEVIREQDACVFDVIAPSTPRSAEMIARAIADRLCEEHRGT